MQKKLSFELKNKLVEVGGTCFWYRKNYQLFFESCGVKRDHYLRYKDENKYSIMRNILSDLEEKNDIETIMSILSNLYNLRSIPDNNVPDAEKSRKILQELKDMCGEDLLKREAKKREIVKERQKREKLITKRQDYSERLELLNRKFLDLCASDNPQQRGFDLEPLVYDLFRLNEIECHKSYRTDDEQIDGYYFYDKFHYLVETKWMKEPIKQGELAVFDKKIDRKLQSTRGLFISMSGFSEDSIRAYSGHKPRLILMDGEDLALILSGRVLLEDALRAKVENVVKNGNVFFRLRNLK